MSTISTMSTTTSCHEHGDPIANYNIANYNFLFNLNDFDLSSTQDVESILNSPCSEHHLTPFPSPSPSPPSETHAANRPQPQQYEIQPPIQLPQQQLPQQQLLQGLEDILREDPDDLIDNFGLGFPLPETHTDTDIEIVSPSPSPSPSPDTKAIAFKGLQSGARKTSSSSSSSSSSHDVLIHSLFPPEVLHYQRNEFNEWKKQHGVGKLAAPVQQRLTAMRRKLHSRVYAKHSRHKNQEKQQVKLTEMEQTKLENTQLKQESTQQKSEIALLKQRLRELGQHV